MNAAQYKQTGSTTLGIIVGVVLGLAVALGVSLYLATSSMPIKDKAANPAAKNEVPPPKDATKLPDPNESLYTKPKDGEVKPDNTTVPPAPPAVPASAATKPSPAATVAKPSEDPIGKIAATVTPAPAAATLPSTAAAPPAKPISKPVAAAAPAVTMPPVSPPGAGGERYFVQAGAYSSLAEAESNKAKLALQGVSMQVSNREAPGGVVYRVRTLPLSAVDAEKLQKQLKVNGIETSLVKVQ